MGRRREPSVRSRALTWIALGIALSPIVVGWVRDLGIERMQWGPWAALVLFALCAWDEGRHPRPPRRAPALGISMITGGLSIGILGMLGDTPSLARAAIPLSLLGVSAWQGRPRPVVAALALLAFPLPLFVLRVGSPQLESFWAAIGAALARGLGFDVVAQGPLLVSGGMRMTVDPVDGGIPIVHVLAAAAWVTEWNDSTTSARAIAMRVAVLVPLAIPVQILSMTMANIILATVGREGSLTWLDHGAPLLAAALACAVPRHRRRAR